MRISYCRINQDYHAMDYLCGVLEWHAMKSWHLTDIFLCLQVFPLKIDIVQPLSIKISVYFVYLINNLF